MEKLKAEDLEKVSGGRKTPTPPNLEEEVGLAALDAHSSGMEWDEFYAKIIPMLCGGKVTDAEALDMAERLWPM